MVRSHITPKNQGCAGISNRERKRIYPKKLRSFGIHENSEWDRWVFSIASASHSANTAQTVTTAWTKRLVESFNTLQGLESLIQTLLLFLDVLTLARTPSKGPNRPPKFFP